jgi:hypothetical protein
MLTISVLIILDQAVDSVNRGAHVGRGIHVGRSIYVGRVVYIGRVVCDVKDIDINDN